MIFHNLIYRFSVLYRFIRRDVSLLLKSPVEYLYSFTYSTNKKVHIRPFNPRVGKTGEKLIANIRKVYPDLKTYFIGSAALGIPGQRDIDIMASCQRNDFDKYLDGLVLILGKPQKTRRTFIEWHLKKNNCTIDFLLIDTRNKSMFLNPLIEFDILKKDKKRLDEYIRLKKELNGFSEREYIKRRMEFFNRIRKKHDMITIYTVKCILQKVYLKSILILLVLVSLISNVWFYPKLTLLGVGFGDAWSRLNIARRVVDSLTPGIAQIGGIWLPFPQLLVTPFASIDFLYFNGIAGAFISTPAFILGGLFLYGSVFILTKNRLISLLGTLIYAGNLNLLYMATTPMSEALFICSLLGTVYFFLRWQTDIKNNLPSLIAAGFWVFLATLTRYEGYFLFAAAAFCVCLVTALKERKIRYVEGTFLIFTTLAAFGIFLWLIYSWVIFGDPLNWLKIYTGQIAVVSTVTQKPTETWGITDNRGNFAAAMMSMVRAALEMNGVVYVIPLFLSVIFIFYFILKYRRNEIFTSGLCALIIASSPVLFFILSSIKGSALIRTPPINLSMFSDTTFSFQDEYNIRYGLLAFPFMIILPIVVLSRVRLFKGFFILFALSSIILPFLHKPVTTYSLARHYLHISMITKYDFQNWFKKNYDGGLILTSAIANDQLMYSLKIPYRNYIYEGTNKYWRESVVDPTKYARWIMFKNGPKVTETGGSSDFVSYYLQDTDILNSNYNLVYKDKDIRLYKIKEDKKVIY